MASRFWRGSAPSGFASKGGRVFDAVGEGAAERGDLALVVQRRDLAQQRQHEAEHVVGLQAAVGVGGVQQLQQGSGGDGDGVGHAEAPCRCSAAAFSSSVAASRFTRVRLRLGKRMSLTTRSSSCVGAAHRFGEAERGGEREVVQLGVGRDEIDQHAGQVVVHAGRHRAGWRHGGRGRREVREEAARMGQQRFGLQEGPLQQLGDGLARQRIGALLAEQVERGEVQRAFERAGEPFVGLGLALGPQAQCPRPHEHFGVAGAAGLEFGRGADLVGLPQIACRVDLGEAGLHLDQRGHRGLQRLAGDAGAAVGKGLGVEAVAPRRVQVARVGARIGRRGLQDAVDHVVLAAVALPQQVVRQLVAEHGLQLRALQALHERAREHDVRLARQEKSVAFIVPSPPGRARRAP
jgi:hypothetical protein